jgi:hypothetical protein
MHGREETIPAMPRDVEQCFKECGLLDPWSTDVIEWWASAELYARAYRNEQNAKTGREAERLTVEYETKRVGEKPDWKSLDSAFVGYDILSKVSSLNGKFLLIEVKGSERRPKEAVFSFTSAAYRVAAKNENYVLHLWHVSKDPQHHQLYVVPFVDVERHLPVNRESGRWENTLVPFSSFTDYRIL